MDSGLKQRLVGAVVLVALAVIFLPMLLDGSGARERLNEDIAIPQQPEAPESRLERDPSGSQADATMDEAADATLATDGFGNDGGSAVNDAGTQATTDPDGETTAQANAEASARPDAEGPASNGARDQATGEDWVVQVGSFQQQTNALVLRDRLREDGFEATTEQVETDDATLWRVWIGPVSGRDEGKALEKRIEDHRGSDALLMEYSR